jgi:hypothetical protein
MNAASIAAVAAFSHPGDDLPVEESAVDMSNSLRTGEDREQPPPVSPASS